ncbi:MAG: M28 family peptidase [Gemmatimonadaceae bacterium]|nr:M28 family peptidase [Gemmatimonadaceae bacterium]
MITMLSTLILSMACSDSDANGGGGAQAATPGPFSGEQALAYVKAQLDFGPRVPGGEAHRKTGDWIVQMMKARADTVIEQRWDHTAADGKVLPLRNVFARFRPEATERVLYVTHWDTRPRSDNARDPEQKLLPVPGANDGASGTAMLIALGDVLKQTPPAVGVDFLFVDGEDYGEFGPPEVDVLLGAKHFAEFPLVANYTPLFGVLWDMIGDRDLKFEKEANSMREAPEVVARVWEQANALGYGSVFVPTEGIGITDDHIPLLKVGIRVIDVIDLDFKWHHTPEDTIDKISAASLKIVGDVALALVTAR